MAAARTAARTGVPIMRPLALVDPGDERAWTINDAYMFGPALWVAPVLEEGAERRRTYLPRGQWIDFWTGARVTGGRDVVVPAPLERIPVWVREGSIVTTHPTRVGRRRPRRGRPFDAAARGDAMGPAEARPREGPACRRNRDLLPARSLDRLPADRLSRARGLGQGAGVAGGGGRRAADGGLPEPSTSGGASGSTLPAGIRSTLTIATAAMTPAIT